MNNTPNNHEVAIDLDALSKDAELCRNLYRDVTLAPSQVLELIALARTPAAGALEDAFAAPGELHDAIMNIPCRPRRGNHPSVIAYKAGHRDARHAAAELAAASAAPGDLRQPLAEIDMLNSRPGSLVRVKAPSVLGDLRALLDEAAQALESSAACDEENDIPDAPEYARDLAKRLRAAPGEQAAVPAGWKLAPIEPTERMMHAAQDVAAPRPFGAVYRAMLAAAPSAPAREAAPVEAKPQWISVSERLPEDCQDVFVLCIDTEWEPAIWQAQWLSGSKTFESSSNGWAGLEDISHWMPRPAAPAPGSKS